MSCMPPWTGCWPVSPLHELPLDRLGEAGVEVVAQPGLQAALVAQVGEGVEKAHPVGYSPDGRRRDGFRKARVAEVDRGRAIRYLRATRLT